MDDSLPTEFDLIVVGTGLTASIIAAAASRIGKSVLHLDSNDFYGGYWASFNLDNINAVRNDSSDDNIREVNELSANSIKLSDNLCRLVNVSQEFHVGDGGDDDGEQQSGEEVSGVKWTKGKVMKEFRKFNIDVTPKAISMSTTNTPFKVGLARTNKFLSSLERYGNTPFLSPMYGCGEIPQCFCRLCAVFGGVYCLKRSITEIYFAENGDDGQLVFDAIQCDKQRIKAKNVVFGHGSISSARFGAASGADGSIKENDPAARKVHCGNLSRGIFVTDTPIGDESVNSGGGGVTFLRMPSAQNTGADVDGAFVIQLSHWSGCCPKGFYLVHITCQSSGTSAKKDLAQYVDKLFKNYCWHEPDSDETVSDTTNRQDAQSSSSPSRLLWSMYFNIPSCLKCEHANETPIPGLHLMCVNCLYLFLCFDISQAKNLFTKIYPTEEFLPRAPDPDEIIIGGDDDDNNDDSNIKLDIQEKIADVVEGIDDEVKCIQENDLNESRE